MGRADTDEAFSDTTYIFPLVRSIKFWWFFFSFSLLIIHIIGFVVYKSAWSFFFFSFDFFLDFSLCLAYVQRGSVVSFLLPHDLTYLTFGLLYTNGYLFFVCICLSICICSISVKKGRGGRLC